MPSLVVVGGQWGDEGKGKLVDCLTADAGWVSRFQGGDNAGHTLVVEGRKTKLRLIPSGILRPQARCVIGAGVVVNPAVLIQEIKGLQAVGVKIDPSRLIIDRDAHIVLEYHQLIDVAREELLGKQKIGTTGRGIGPVYEDRSARRGVRFADLFAAEALKVTLQSRVEEKNRYLRDVLGSQSQVRFEQLWSSLCESAEILKPYVGNASLQLHCALGRGEKVVFEGAQATMLDITFGTVPFVTACSTMAGAVTTGVGLGPKAVNYVLGVAKAYCTRVGSGPFPSELTDKIGDGIRERGAEFGTVTGRPRRCGWFDAVAMKRAVRLNGFDSVAITKLDVLSGVPTLKICTGYTLDGKKLDDVPALAAELERVVPEFVEMEGWPGSIEDAKKMADLPKQAKVFVDKLSDLIECPISIVSVGPDRESLLLNGQDDLLRQFIRE